MAKFKISKEKLAELKDELKASVAARSEIVERVSVARALGDLKENAEYHYARDDQRANEAKIEEIERILKDYELVDSTKMRHEEVAVGCAVKLKGPDNKSFIVVSSVESDPANGKVSDESPIGQLLLGKKVGDEIEIAGKKYKVVGIS